MTSVKQSLKNKIGAVYMRVSTANQEEEKTVEGQWMELRDRISADGVILPKDNIYKDEGWSGALIERPELDRLRNDAKIGKFSILYIYDKGRLSRNFIHQELILEDFKKQNIKVVELHGGIEGETSESVMFGQMMGVFQQYERVKIAERMRLGKMRIVKENKQLLGYNPCFGYDLNKTIKTGANKRRASFSINKNEAEIVRYIYKLCASGLSMYKIRNRLKKEGIKSPKGSVWGNNTLRRLLTNETYIGKHYYNKLEAIESDKRYTKRYKKVVKNSRRERPKEEWLPIEVEPIIGKELFMKVQKQLEKNKKYNPRRSKNQYLLSGLIQCSCGKARSGDPGGKNSTYYRCVDRLCKDRKCHLHGINSVVLDKLVWEQVRNLLIQPDLLLRYARKWIQDKNPYAEEEKEILGRIEKLKKKHSKFIDAYGDGILSEDEFRKKSDEMKNIENELCIKLAEIQKQKEIKPNVKPEIIAESVVKLLVGNLDELSFEDKQAIIREIIVRVIADPKEVVVIGKIPITDSGEVSINSVYQQYWNSIKSQESENLENGNISLTDKEIGYKLKNRYYQHHRQRLYHQLQHQSHMPSPNKRR